MSYFDDYLESIREKIGREGLKPRPKPPSRRAPINAKRGKKGSDYRAGRSIELPAIEESIIPDEELG